VTKHTLVRSASPTLSGDQASIRIWFSHNLKRLGGVRRHAFITDLTLKKMMIAGL
jgi:hypothetical protein